METGGRSHAAGQGVERMTGAVSDQTSNLAIKARRKRLQVRVGAVVGMSWAGYQAWHLFHGHAGWLPVTNAVLAAVLSLMYFISGSKS